MTPYIQDADFTLYVGDVQEVLAGLPDESVDCVVTSPPYWGLRDYGTGEWEGGDESCDHKGSERYYTEKTAAVSSAGAFSEPGEANKERLKKGRWREAGDCKCGARRVDRQIGLEATPDLFVARMVEVFREVRRVLAPHGTCWVNLGDSYNTGTSSPRRVPDGKWKDTLGEWRDNVSDRINVAALKPKDLVGIPWRVAFALQADGWYLRSDIIWAKPNPMPESVTDRPTKAHEYVFLLTKGPRYWFDQEAVREKYQENTIARDAYGYNQAFRNQFQGSPTDERHQDGKQMPPGSFAKGPDGRRNTRVVGADGSIQHRDGERWPNGGRNIRSVWEIATQPYPEAHFATFPEELPRRAIAAGCSRWVCRVCGKPRERIVERVADERRRVDGSATKAAVVGPTGAERRLGPNGWNLPSADVQTVGWSDCECSGWTGGSEIPECVLNGRACHDHCSCPLVRCDHFQESGATCHRCGATRHLLSEGSAGQGSRDGVDRALPSESKWRPGVVLDPFMGSGTTALVARRLERHSIGIELNQEYADLCARRLSQLSLLA